MKTSRISSEFQACPPCGYEANRSTPIKISGAQPYHFIRGAVGQLLHHDEIGVED